jgi:monofunctional biosynthetic peptidoglycan transglycosylase
VIDFRHPTTLFAVVLFGTLGSAFVSLQKSSCSEEISPYEISSTFIVDLLSAEDPLFFQHGGIDFHRLRQAVRETLSTEKFGRGGSTISMQLAKVCYLSQEKTLFRKASQIWIGAILEHRHNKAEILYRYLESVPFAPSIVGLQAASEHFYGVPPAQLNREQETSLVKTIFNPAEFGPNTQGDPQAGRLRSAVIRGLGRRYCVSFRRNFLETPDIKVVFKPCQ